MTIFGPHDLNLAPVALLIVGGVVSAVALIVAVWVKDGRS